MDSPLRRLRSNAGVAVRERWLDDVLELLRGVHRGLGVEVSSPEDGARELVVTARGDAKLFALVEDLVRRAPPHERWRFVALKPALGAEFEHRWRDVRIQVRELWWTNLSLTKDRSRFGVRLLLPGAASVPPEDLDEVARVIVATVLGERDTGTFVGHVEGVVLEPPLEEDRLLKATDLPRFLAWWRRKTASP
jgi:hypothetical protein